MLALILLSCAPRPELCSWQQGRLRCSHETTRLATGVLGLSPRQVHWQVPGGDAPEQGWAVAILFQGSLFSAQGMWQAEPGDALGGLRQTRTIQALLEAGYAVITPEAHLGGLGCWDTNNPAFAWSWEASPDHAFMLDLFEALEDGVFGPLDPDRLYAAGISSGGYMTSRMALSYPGRFRALAIHSAGWATCSGALCRVDGVPEDHPPTLFLHGATDRIVPPGSLDPYIGALGSAEIEHELLLDEDVGHAWLPTAPEGVAEWFDAHG